MWFEIVKKIVTSGISIYKGVNLKNSIKHSAGITLVLVFLLSNGYITQGVFDILIKIVPSLTFMDYLAFGTILSLGYLVWLALDIVKAYKNYLVKKIEENGFKIDKVSDTEDNNSVYRDKEFKDIEDSKK